MNRNRDLLGYLSFKYLMYFTNILCTLILVKVNFENKEIIIPLFYLIGSIICLFGSNSLFQLIYGIKINKNYNYFMMNNFFAKLFIGFGIAYNLLT